SHEANSTSHYVDVGTSTTSTTVPEEVVPVGVVGSSSSSGGGGGTRVGSIEQTEQEVVYSLPVLAPGEFNIDVTDPYSNINSVEISVNREISNTEISIRNIDIPLEINLFGKALDYYEIVGENLQEGAINEIIINFRYKKDIKPVGLFVYSNEEWSEVTSSEISEDDFYTYYEAISTRLGYYAIGSKGISEGISVEAEDNRRGFGLLENVNIIKNRILNNEERLAVIVALNILLFGFIAVIFFLFKIIKKINRRIKK
ncbi:MAG: hypothetical protein AABW46_01175, partial [Nanoarchaeota archaeon]